MQFKSLKIDKIFRLGEEFNAAEHTYSRTVKYGRIRLASTSPNTPVCIGWLMIEIHTIE